MKIDTHAHFYPPQYLAEIVRLGEASPHPWDKGWYGQIAGKAAGNPKMWAVEERLQEMDRAGVDVQVLSTPTPNVYFEDGEVSLHLAQIVNDTLADLCRRHPDRFRAFASIPLGHPKKALEEMHRAIDSLGLHGLILGDNIRGQTLDAPQFRPVLEEADRLGLIIFLHPMTPPGAELLSEYDLVSLVGFMFDNTQAAARLAFGGVLERCRNLKVIVPHLGGAFPYLIGRMDLAYQIRPQCRQNISQPPSHYLKALYVDTVSFHIPALRCAYETLGADHMLLGSDHPFGLGGMEPCIQGIKELGLPQEEEERILGGNMARLLGNLARE
jgi:aminocarboxymuconate-semialdehyde decarboxylase